MKATLKAMAWIIITFTFPDVCSQESFPPVMPLEKPDRPLSAAMERMYEQWNPLYYKDSPGTGGSDGILQRNQSI